MTEQERDALLERLETEQRAHGGMLRRILEILQGQATQNEQRDRRIAALERKAV